MIMKITKIIIITIAVINPHNAIKIIPIKNETFPKDIDKIGIIIKKK